jgi:PTS system mannitol-specific IIC component
MTVETPGVAAPATTPPKSSVRARVQAFGGFLTAMVIPNVGAFIAWGFITALFIPKGWVPSEHFAQLVDPIVQYLLPLLLAYTGGRLVHGHRGGVAGTLGAIGLIIGAEIPMFLGAMIMGPLSAWIVKKFDALVQPRIRPGLEMVVNNFSLGLIGLGLCLLSFEAIGPLIEGLNTVLLRAIEALVASGFLPILALINEPAKVLFLNNVIDQGIYYPLGLQQAAEVGQSIFFTVASNPGPGLGLLLAYWVFSSNRTIKNSSPGAIIIHFIGGIHEIYFPYVLMKPITIVGMIAGAASGIATFSAFGAGLTAGPSPGSIISYLALTPRGNYVGIIAGVVVATAVTFAVTAVILRLDRKRDGQDDDDLEQHAQRSRAMKAEGATALAATPAPAAAAATQPTVVAAAATEPAPTATTHAPNKIVFACDAGMGSSTMGASIFRKKLAQRGRSDLDVVNTSIERVPADADVVVVHENLAERTRAAHPGVELVTISNYLNDPALDGLLDDVSADRKADNRAD